MANQTVIKLQDGNVMPQLGLGVWKAGNDEVVSAIHKALEVGYRSIDTAAAYKNEDGVGKALASAGVPRDEFSSPRNCGMTIKSVPAKPAGEPGEAPARFRRSLSHALAGSGHRPLR
jgi:aryl-alcohol dehydrogenase-like predicted oxidoreductase